MIGMLFIHRPGGKSEGISGFEGICCFSQEAQACVCNLLSFIHSDYQLLLDAPFVLDRQLETFYKAFHFVGRYESAKTLF